jgi:hypothetical protein
MISILMNAFSLNMLGKFPAELLFCEISLETARADLLEYGFVSAVGHPDTAAVFSQVLGLPVAHVRSTVSLKEGDCALIGQYRGPPLAEGATQLPEGATIQWIRMTL